VPSARELKRGAYAVRLRDLSQLSDFQVGIWVTLSRGLESLSIRDISGSQLFGMINLYFVRLPNCLNIIYRSYSGNSNIELPMCKHWPPKIQPNMLDHLALRFIDCHSKTKSDWKLPSIKLEGHLLFSWRNWDPWDKDLFPRDIE
jgi:hypothetical protein